MRKSLFALLPACVLLAVAVPASAEFYDATSEFATTATASSGVWSYGFIDPSAATPTFVPYANFTNDFHGSGYSAYYYDGDSSHFNTPVIGATADPAYLLMHPGYQGLMSVLRFTAPGDDTYTVSASFVSLDKATTDVHVIQNSVGGFAFSGNVTPETDVSNAVTTSQIITMSMGDTVDFEVGYGNGSYNFDSTGLSASVVTPEPGTFALFGVGGVIVGLIRRNRSQRRSA